MRTIKNLVTSTNKAHIYIYLKDRTVGQQFLRDAQAEGFTLCGTPLSEIKPQDIFAVRDDMTVCYSSIVPMIIVNSIEITTLFA